MKRSFYYWVDILGMRENFLFIALAGLAGLFFGSFFNCVINPEPEPSVRYGAGADKRGLGAPSAPSRIHPDSRNRFHCRAGADIWRRRSACPKCGHKLGFWDLIPVLSFIFLRGRCRYCKQKISWQYPIVELTTAVLFAFVAWYHVIFNFHFLIFNQLPIINYFLLFRDLIFVSFLLLIFVFDLKYNIIPDRISIPAIVIAIGFNILLILIVSPHVIARPDRAIQISKIFLAIFVGGGFFLAQHLISKGKWIGGGDIRLGALMGAMLSWPNILVALFSAYVAGAVYGIAAIVLKKKTIKSTVPFGTFLTVAAFIALFFGTQIVNWYLSLSNQLNF